MEGKQGEFSSLCPFNFSTLNLINFYNLLSYQSLLCAVDHHNATKNCANLIVFLYYNRDLNLNLLFKCITAALQPR